MSLRETAQDVRQALPKPEDAQILIGPAFAFVVTDDKIFEIYQTGDDIFVQVAKRDTFEAVGDDTMWWATIPGESNPHFTDEALEPYRVGDEAEYQPYNEGYGPEPEIVTTFTAEELAARA